MQLPLFRAGAILTLLSFLPTIQAETKLPLEIKGVAIGYPGGTDFQWKVGSWNPVFITLESGKEAFDQRKYVLLLETTDSDEAASQVTAPVPTMPAKSTTQIMTFVRIGNTSGNLSVRAMERDGGTVHAAGRAARANGMVEPSEILYVTLGRLPSLRTALQQELPNENDRARAEREARRFAFLDKVAYLPTVWYGYDGVDVLVMPSSREFLENLISDDRGRFAALTEWVRRGGRLVLAIGREHQLLTQLPGLTSLIHCQINGSVQKESLLSLRNWSSVNLAQQAIQKVEVTKITPGRNVSVLVEEPGSDGQPPLPLVLEAPVGRGRVLLTAFDLNSQAFADWKGQGDFWRKIHKVIAPARPIANIDPGMKGGFYQEENELARQLQRGLESFEEVPVISFGWIALFILIYILIVGPLEYFVLKKIFKRMELTWITFPIVVVVISVAAYFTAYAVKGNDLRINKIDVVDIDLNQNTVQGTAWVTLFSPRIQTWTISVEPVWNEQAKESSVHITPLSPPDSSMGGSGRPGGGSLFRSPYRYADQAQGIRGVPIPVWAARSFQASWLQTKGADQLIEAKIHRAPDNSRALYGTLTSRLPVALDTVSIHYKGSWYSDLGTLSPGMPLRFGVKGLMLGVDEKNNSNQWLSNAFPQTRSISPDLSPEGVRRKPQPSELDGPSDLMKSILFHTHPGDPRSGWDNTGLRSLDQGWRLKPLERLSDSGRQAYLDEIIVVGRAALPSQPSETALSHKAAATRLWLGALPGEGERPSVPGYLSQETYVRIFIPVDRE